MSSRVSVAFVVSLARRYTKDQLLAKIDEASAELEAFMDPDVIVTGANMKESGTSGEYRQGELERKLASYKAAYDYKVKLEQGAGGIPNPGVSHVSFRFRPWGF